MLVLGMVVVLPIAISFARVGPDWMATADTVSIVEVSRDVTRGHLPLLGQASTAGDEAHHLGPIESYVLAGPSRGPQWALPFTVAVLGAVWVVSTVLGVFRRYGFGPAGVAVAGLTAVLVSVSGFVLVDVWNPYFGLIPFAVFLVAVALALDGDRPSIVFAAVAGSVAAQAHLSFVPPVGGVMIVVLGVLVVRTRSGSTVDESAPAARGWVLGAAISTGVLWLPPLLHELGGSASNLHAVFAGSGDGAPRLGFDAARTIVTRALAPPTALAGSPLDADHLLSAATPAVSLAAAVVVGLVGAIAWRHRRQALGWAALVTLTALSAGAVGMTRIPVEGLLSAHNYLWMWPVTAMAYAVIALGLVAALGRADTFGRRHADIAVGALLGVTLIATLVIAIRVPLDRNVIDPVRSLADQIDPTVEGPVVLDLGGDFATYSVGSGLAHELDRRGKSIRVVGIGSELMGRRLQVDPCEGTRDVLLVVHGSQAVEAVDPVARFTPSPDESARRVAAESSIRAAIEENGGITTSSGGKIDVEDAVGLLEQGAVFELARLDGIESPVLTGGQIDGLASLARRPNDAFAVLSGQRPC